MKEKFPGFANRLESLIKDLDIQKGSFAASLGVEPSQISNILSRVSNPSNTLIKLISERYSVNEDWLRSGVGMPNAKKKEVVVRPKRRNEMRIKALMANAEEILRSESPFAEALERNIDAFWYGFSLERKESVHPPEPAGEVPP